MRKLKIVGVAIAVLAIAFLIARYFKNSKKPPVQKLNKIEKTVFVQEVKNGEIPVNISANGSLVAKNKIALFAEVQGVLQATGKDFRAGVRYKKGQTLLRINNQEFYASIQSQRSSLQNLIASIMPDIRLDFPEDFEKWDTYLKNFDINKAVQPLPKPSSDKGKYFLTGKNIYTTYYNIKNSEVRLGKYRINAPFNGVLTEALVTSGTLVRPGQKLGEFIDVSVFELPLSVNAAFAAILKEGKTVTLHDLEKTNKWTGKVSRINSKINQNTQTVQVFIEVKGQELREGMYLEANVPAKTATNAFEINRKLLVDNNAVYVVKNNTLDLVEVTPVHFNENTVIIKGLKDGEQLVSKPVPGAYIGMPIKIFSETQEQTKK
ncbi:efflux RND transporter periplasmic adaptor subunit [Tenacibaculum tangerinum]|uniref:Efflux RND transporter periplasmic adaptor subunit n=1 Tax=Tenacibaculum tangerinum TaxID=3038772 RepID=A0ABY8L8C7_9FLAO|nr:efflux RND transporter periplasmic adaptor subunit [Tenacibaculum tangerinum]WGH76438.1 efflux RND transporter periplasmic adaptor subunit [Tenacibaculum tangerinum]